MGKPTFDSRNSKTSGLGVRTEMSGAKPQEVLDFRLSREGMKLPNKIGGFKLTRGTETSQYPEERRSTDTPLVVASERGPGQCASKDK